MNGRPARTGGLAVPFVVAGALMALVAASPLKGKEGSLLMALVYWIAVVEGCVAAVAAGTLVNARWVRSVGKELLSVSPLLLLASFLFLLLIPFVGTYPWSGGKGIWLRKDFFIGRNLGLLLLAYVAARRLDAALSGVRGGKKTRAAEYLFIFVASQSLAAFDLVMSLEYPWYSALFGGYFFVESVYGGFAAAAVVWIARHGGPREASNPEGRSSLQDIAILMFGFSLMWAGLFFAQYLTIWYANLPEEVGFVARRVSVFPLRELSVAVLFLMFLIPFPALLATRAKSNRYLVSAVSACILSGILIERYVFMAPAVGLNAAALAVDFVCLLVLFVLILYRSTRGIPLEPGGDR